MRREAIGQWRNVLVYQGLEGLIKRLSRFMRPQRRFAQRDSSGDVSRAVTSEGEPKSLQKPGFVPLLIRTICLGEYEET